jgi:hypothetical protein
MMETHDETRSSGSEVALFDLLPNRNYRIGLLTLLKLVHGSAHQNMGDFVLRADAGQFDAVARPASIRRYDDPAFSGNLGNPNRIASTRLEIVHQMANHWGWVLPREESAYILDDHAAQALIEEEFYWLAQAACK